MNQVQVLERTFALHGVDCRSDPELERFLVAGVQHKLDTGALAPQPCGYCNRLLTDPVSILRGYGAECERKVVADREAGERFPKGCEVRVIGGAYEGAIGVVGAYTPRRHKRPVKAPFVVHFAGYHARYTADQLERVEVAE